MKHLVLHSESLVTGDSVLCCQISEAEATSKQFLLDLSLESFVVVYMIVSIVAHAFMGLLTPAEDLPHVNTQELFEHLQLGILVGAAGLCPGPQQLLDIDVLLDIGAKEFWICLP